MKVDIKKDETEGNWLHAVRGEVKNIYIKKKTGKICFECVYYGAEGEPSSEKSVGEEGGGVEATGMDMKKKK